MSKLYYRYGAMNAGKTLSLLAVNHNYIEQGKNTLILKSVTDSRSSVGKIESRAGLSAKCDDISNDTDLYKHIQSHLNLNGNLDCILVDESQFLSRDQVDELFMYAKLKNKPVICYGLRSDFKSLAFPGSQRLFEVADVMEELITICRCGKRAKFNGRIVNGEFTSSGEQVAIDGENEVEYESLCGRCYLNKVLGITLDNSDFKE